MIMKWSHPARSRVVSPMTRGLKSAARHTKTESPPGGERTAIANRHKSGRRDSNAQQSAWKADALPLSYARVWIEIDLRNKPPISASPSATAASDYLTGQGPRIRGSNYGPLNQNRGSPLEHQLEDQSVLRACATSINRRRQTHKLLSTNPDDHGALPKESAMRNARKTKGNNLETNKILNGPDVSNSTKGR